MSNQQGKTTATSIRFDTTLYFKLQRIAQNDNRSFGNLINHIADRYIMQIQQERPELLTPKKISNE